MAPTQKKILNPILERIKLVSKPIAAQYLDWPSDPELFLQRLWELEQGCKECPLHSTRNKVSQWDGDHNAKIVIIGEGPGFLEDIGQFPLASPTTLSSSECNDCSKARICYSSRLLKSPQEWGKKAKLVKCEPNFVKGKFNFPKQMYIRSSGAILDAIIYRNWGFNHPRKSWINLYNKTHKHQSKMTSPWFITNAVRCRSLDPIKLRDTAPPNMSLEMCKRYLYAEIAAVNPTCIIAVGKVALKLLCKSEDESKSIPPGKWFDSKLGPVVHCLHIAHTMREEDAYLKALGFAKVERVLQEAVEFAKI